MAEKIRIVISTPGTHRDFLMVQDTMNQILDYFSLATGDDVYSKEMGWKLTAISMQSPLVVDGEPIGLTPDVDVDPIAQREMGHFERRIKEISEGRIPQEWTTGKSSEIVKRILSRSKNGIGKTEVFLREAPVSIDITPQIAEKAIVEIERQEEPSGFFKEDRSRDELGLVEGYLNGVGTDYDHPAVQILDRLTESEIWCRVPDEVRENIAKNTNFNDVWEHRRVIVRGLLRYDQAGKIRRVFDSEIVLVSTKPVSVDDIRDRGFTSGLSPSEYLDKLREGELG